MSNLDDLEERFRQMEREINNKVETPMKSADPFKSEFNQATENTVETAKTSLSGLVAWINSLTGVTKTAAIAVVGILTFAIVRFLVNLVAAAISVAFMVAIAYLLYKLFFETKSASKP